MPSWHAACGMMCAVVDCIVRVSVSPRCALGVYSATCSLRWKMRPSWRYSRVRWRLPLLNWPVGHLQSGSLQSTRCHTSPAPMSSDSWCSQSLGICAGATVPKETRKTQLRRICTGRETCGGAIYRDIATNLAAQLGDRECCSCWVFRAGTAARVHGRRCRSLRCTSRRSGMDSGCTLGLSSH